MKLNNEFIQHVYENGKYIRSFSVGPSNPFYAPLSAVSPFIVNSILTSEDGNFYFHNGFNEEAFRHSIAANFKAGKFVRGGSTISMQLVKNVFLTRRKTIARKAEEALLVWLIESNRICSKERMLEVYLNIIELGPDVYGVGEASHFYFMKKPSEITLNEGIFLASLLPRPKGFKFNFDTLGNLKPAMADYYRIVSDFMLKKNLITQQEHDELKPHVELTGPARTVLLPVDTLKEEESEFKLD
jgi:membrane peptidoglycan carboxypeptidase